MIKYMSCLSLHSSQSSHTVFTLKHQKMYRHCKVTIVGDAGVGKTAMCIAYAINKPHDPNQYQPSIFDSWGDEKKLDDGRIVRISLWDTIGSDEYKKLRPCSYGQTSVFLMCFSIADPKSFENISIQWIPECMHHCPEGLIMIVGCKKDLKDNQIFNSLQQANILISGYVNGGKGVKRVPIPFDVSGMIGEYLQNCYFEKFVEDKDVEQLCKQLGRNVKYVKCSATQFEGLKQVFQTAMYCFLDHEERQRGGKKGCNIL